MAGKVKIGYRDAEVESFAREKEWTIFSSTRPACRLLIRPVAVQYFVQKPDGTEECFNTYTEAARAFCAVAPKRWSMESPTEPQSAEGMG